MGTFVVVYRNFHGRELRRICNTEQEAKDKAFTLRAQGFNVLSIGPIAYYPEN